MWCLRVDEGIVFGGMDADVVETLRGVPMLIESADLRVRGRLLPETCDDEDDERHWRQHAVPELERLFLSRAQLVRRDLQTLKKLGKTQSLLLVPHEHVSAWLAALNAARLALFELNELKAEHMSAEDISALPQKQQEAIWRIDLLAGLQSVLLGDVEVQDGGSIDDYVIE